MEIDKLLIFEIGGKFAQFKKFYTNSSSLTYPIPPRTVLKGMVASILEENRDEYYNWLSPSNSKFGIKIINGGYGIMQCLNYLNPDNKSRTTPKRLQILKATNNKSLKYQIYFYCNDDNKYNELKERLKTGNLGYGVYLGQRQFRGYAKYIGETDNIQHIEKHCGELNSCVCMDNVMELNYDNVKLLRERIPISFKKETKAKQNGREPLDKMDIIIEEEGKKISGKFSDIYQINNEYICLF